MFDIDRFAADCRTALAERGSEAIRDVVRSSGFGTLGILWRRWGSRRGLSRVFWCARLI